MIKALAFDVDGVLLDVRERYCYSFGYALERQGVIRRIDKRAVIDMRRGGKSGREILEALLGDGDTAILDEAEKIRKRVSVEENLFMDRPFRGVNSLLANLKKMGLSLAVFTFRHDGRKLVAQFRQYGLERRFDTVVLGNDSGSIEERRIKLGQLLKEFRVLPREMVFVDDTELGLRAGRAMGIVTAGVLSGLSGLELLEKERPSMILEKVTGIRGILERFDAEG